MKRNSLYHITHFFFKYIWIICIILSITEIVFTFGTANVLMQESSKGIIRSVCGEISSRVDGVLRLLQGLAEDERISDLSIPLYDRAIIALPYQKSYDLYMIALTDENVNVISCDETEPPAEPTSLAYRDYMQQLYQTGTYQITDAFIAGADHTTVNYTIAVPIIKEGAVRGSVFGSIYFDNIQQIITQKLGDNRHFYLLGNENTIMAGSDQSLTGMQFLEATKDIRTFGKTHEEIDADMIKGTASSYWEWEDGQLWFVSYQGVSPAPWTLVYRVQFSSVFLKLLPGVLGKISIYILMCIAIYYLGTSYMRRQLADINHVMDRMTSLQKEIFQTEYTSYDNLIDLTKSGLTDQLTGLPTRTILLDQAPKKIEQSHSAGAVLFIDMDDLKMINDSYGHEAGDYAIAHFANVLKNHISHNGIAARYGGDEFIFVMDGITDNDAVKLAENICSQCNASLDVKGHSFQTHASIGISCYPKHGSTLEELICKADLALYTAKQAGKNGYELYSDQ